MQRSSKHLNTGSAAVVKRREVDAASHDPAGAHSGRPDWHRHGAPWFPRRVRSVPRGPWSVAGDAALGAPSASPGCLVNDKKMNIR
jgi:hypothetical protein